MSWSSSVLSSIFSINKFEQTSEIFSLVAPGDAVSARIKWVGDCFL